MASITRLKKPRMTARDRHRAKIAAAMPEVKRLVHKYGRQAVANCLQKLRLHEKELGRLSELRAEIARLEKQL